MYAQPHRSLDKQRILEELKSPQIQYTDSET